MLHLEGCGELRRFGGTCLRHLGEVWGKKSWRYVGDMFGRLLEDGDASETCSEKVWSYLGMLLKSDLGHLLEGTYL